MFAQDHLFHTHRYRVFTDSQMSQIKYNYYINNAFKEQDDSREAEKWKAP
jgi:hypothetical protein